MACCEQQSFSPQSNFLSWFIGFSEAAIAKGDRAIGGWRVVFKGPAGVCVVRCLTSKTRTTQPDSRLFVIRKKDPAQGAQLVRCFLYKNNFEARAPGTTAGSFRPATFSGARGRAVFFENRAEPLIYIYNNLKFGHVLSYS